MTRIGWDALANWRDQRMGEVGDLWHRSLIDPTLLAVLGPVRGHRVLDIGCGNGYLTRRFRRQGAARAVGVDGSLASIRIARRREAARPSGAEFVHGNAAHLPQFEDGAFDRIVANMALMDIRDAGGTLREISRLLSFRGRLVFSINHPCFDVDENSAWLVERAPYHETISRRIARYRRERPVRVAWKISDTERAYTQGYHRTLETYSRYLRGVGLAIVRMAEPFPKREFIRKSPQGRFVAEIPLHLVIEAVAWGRNPTRPLRTAVGAKRSPPTAQPNRRRMVELGRRRSPQLRRAAPSTLSATNWSSRGRSPRLPAR